MMGEEDGRVCCVNILGFGGRGREGRRAESGEEWNCLRGGDGVDWDKEHYTPEGNGKGAFSRSRRCI